MYKAISIHSIRDISQIFLPYLSKRKLALLFVSFVSFIAATLGLAAPQLIRFVVKTAIPSSNMLLVGLLGGGVVVAAALAGFFQYLSRYYASLLSQKVVYEIRNDLYVRLQQLSMEFYDYESTGNIMTRVTTDLRSIERLLTFSLRMLMNGIIIFFGSYIAMFIISWQLALILFGLSPFFMYLIVWFSTKVRPLFYAARTQFGQVTTILQENITGYHVVRGFAQEESEIAKFTEANATYRDLRIKAQIYRSIYYTTMTLLIGIGTSIVLAVGGIAVINNKMDLGDFAAFIFYLTLLPNPTRQLTMIVGVLQRALASGDRLLELLKAKLEVHDAPDAIEAPRFRGEIEFKNVWFEYEKNRPVLKGINVHIPAGQKVVILGTTGSGKTTFVNLIPRFYDPTEGKVCIDGVDIKKYKLKSVRKQIGFVLQETFLFNGTIRENIAFGKPDATDEEIEKVAKIANIHDFIVSLPEGYNTHVGDRGITLSGGQQQRIAIARTLLTDPSILIFDDSVSNVDAETEARIQEALSILSEGRTTIIISQRISSVRFADRILVFDEGEIVQDGTHEELIKEVGGAYYNIYQTLASSILEETPTISSSIKTKEA